MNSKARVLAALAHQEPDRVPLDFWWSREMRDLLLSRLQLRDVDELQDYLGSDVRGVYPAYIGPPLRRFQDGSYEDFWGIVRKAFTYGAGEYHEVLEPPLAHARSLDDIEALRWPAVDWFDYEGLVEQCEHYSNRAIIVGRMGRECQTIFIQLWYFRGLEQILVDMVEWPEFVEALIERIMRFRIEHLKRILVVARVRADMLQLADDYGAQDGLIMSPRMWRRFFKPHLKAMADLAHDAGLKVFLHCDGAVAGIIPELIEIGVDILNPIQPHAVGMDLAALKAQYGSRLCFHGAVDTQSTLPFGTPEDVIAEVHERIQVLGAGGGYILAPVHTVEPDVPIENLLAVYEAARAYRRRG